MSTEVRSSTGAIVHSVTMTFKEGAARPTGKGFFAGSFDNQANLENGA
jgi:hypothetical protein